MYFLFSANTLLFSVSVLFRSDCSHQGWTDIFLLCRYRCSRHVNLCVISPGCVSWFKCLFMFVKRRLRAFCVFIGPDFTRDIHVQIWYFSFVAKISCDVSHMSVSRKASSITGEFPLSASTDGTAVLSGKKSPTPQSSHKSAQKMISTLQTVHTSAQPNIYEHPTNLLKLQSLT